MRVNLTESELLLLLEEDEIIVLLFVAKLLLEEIRALQQDVCIGLLGNEPLNVKILGYFNRDCAVLAQIANYL